MNISPFTFAGVTFFSILLVFLAVHFYITARNKKRDLFQRTLKWSDSTGIRDNIIAGEVKNSGQDKKKYNRLTYVEKEASFPFAKAGIYNSTTVKRYWTITILLMVIFPLCFVSGVLLSNHEMTQKYSLIAAALAGVGFFLPYFWLRNRVSKRQFELQKAFPDAMDLLVVCVEAGMGLDSAINRVSSEFIISSPALSEEFHILSLEIKTGRSRNDCWKNFALRVNIDDVHNLVSLLIQAEKFGTGITQALRVNAEDMRLKYFSKLEEKAAKIPVKLTIPLILFIFPALFAVILGPAAIKIYRTLIEQWK
ncbi:MAG: type II secretion system F family protein [Desulfobulbaceae bacterium]|nr:type II secretion system F family protein [Desulfobulbaceae bacterium]